MRKKIAKVCKYTLFTLLGIIVVSLIFPTWTPRIQGENSISRLERMVVNGEKHEVMIRGMDLTNPVLLFVHGGPGYSEIPYVRKYQRELEQHFTIVHYDQRGSGKSFHFQGDYSNLTTDVLVEDLIAITKQITEKLHQEQVILVGHSFGTYIGMKAAAQAPELFQAYIGIGQMADTIQSEVETLEYTMQAARAAGNTDDVRKLEILRESIERGEGLTPRTYVQKYGGSARLINENLDYVTGFLFNSEYNGLDVIRFYAGILQSQDRLVREALDHPLTEVVDETRIPTYFLMGQYDYMTTLKAASDYLDTLKAPEKELVVFQQSAHYPQFEEKERFAAWLVEHFKSN
ncbi:MAG: alpha/beta hydrolase [Paenibacillus sp.]|uniref:alpha/beta fold hydrolase n=1 Tax=Paenibacillus sp. TaxID=58172 RepID=UPI0025EDE090|nr:alpha/beta hydrolase [Paenibacillus sp.]MBR2566181.1 alpha/beta hydrolase [Paenibacillus sp.]